MRDKLPKSLVILQRISLAQLFMLRSSNCDLKVNIPSPRHGLILSLYQSPSAG